MSGTKVPVSSTVLLHRINLFLPQGMFKLVEVLNSFGAPSEMKTRIRLYWLWLRVLKGGYVRRQQSLSSNVEILPLMEKTKT